MTSIDRCEAAPSRKLAPSQLGDLYSVSELRLDSICDGQPVRLDREPCPTILDLLEGVSTLLVSELDSKKEVKTGALC